MSKRGQDGSGPFAGTVPHGDAEPSRGGEGAGKRQVESHRGSSGDEPHEQSENSPMRPRQAGMKPEEQDPGKKSGK